MKRLYPRDCTPTCVVSIVGQALMLTGASRTTRGSAGRSAARGQRSRCTGGRPRPSGALGPHCRWRRGPIPIGSPQRLDRSVLAHPASGPHPVASVVAAQGLSGASWLCCLVRPPSMAPEPRDQRSRRYQCSTHRPVHPSACNPLLEQLPALISENLLKNCSFSSPIAIPDGVLLIPFFLHRQGQKPACFHRSQGFQQYLLAFSMSVSSLKN